MNRAYWTGGILLIAVATGASIWLYPSLPERIPTHWNIRGEVDGYGDKGWAIFLLPAMMAGMAALFYFLPALSPKPFEVESFRGIYLYIMLLTIGLFGYLHGVILCAVWKTVQGSPFDLTRPLIAGICLFFALLGNVLGKVRRNLYIGVRVPWTLASERVWNDTHRLAAWVMVAGGSLGFLMTILGFPILPALAICLGSPLIPVAYSYFHYKSLERAGAL